MIETGLAPSVLAALAPWRMRDVVPVLAGVLHADLPSAMAPRARSVLERNGIDDAVALGRCTVAEIRAWVGVGANMAAAIVGVVVEAGAAAMPATVDPGRELAATTGRDPSPVLDKLDRALAEVGDERDQGVFELRSLRLSERPHLAQIADALGVCDERVRQLQRGAERRMRAAIDACPEVHDEIGALTRALGEATTVRAIDDLLASRRLPALPDVRSLALVWAAGPYQPVEGHAGWVAVDPAELLSETRRMLRADGGVHSVKHLIDDLSAIGVAPELVDEWLVTQPVRRHHDLVVLVAGSTRQVLERALSASGQAMATSELVAWVASPGPQDAGAKAAAVLERDPRFVRVGPDLYELAEWDSTTAADRRDAADQHALQEGHVQTDLRHQNGNGHNAGDGRVIDSVEGQSDEEHHDDTDHRRKDDQHPAPLDVDRHGDAPGDPNRSTFRHRDYGRPEQARDDRGQADHGQLVLVGFEGAGRAHAHAHAADADATSPLTREPIAGPGRTP